METAHFFAILKKDKKEITLVELVENTPIWWRHLERKDLMEKYSLNPSNKYSLFQFSTTDAEDYLPGLLVGDYIHKIYKDKEFHYLKNEI